jgi:hypothetical protein
MKIFRTIIEIINIMNYEKLNASLLCLNPAGIETIPNDGI